MKALSLFSGIGGIDLAAEWAGIETVAFCEREPFCQKVLKKHWPNIPIYDDVCTLTKERLEQDGIGTVDLIFGGYPCQPYSTAGKREGAGDDRALWPEVHRLIETIRPNWFVGENVAGHITLGLDEVLSDLGNIGYTAQSFVIPAVAVNAPHRRQRVFIVAHSRGGRFSKPDLRSKQQGRAKIISASQTMANPESVYAQGLDYGQRKGEPRGSSWWAVEPNVGRVAHGVPNRVDRLKALGNAVVPQQIYPILTAIKQINDMEEFT